MAVNDIILHKMDASGDWESKIINLSNLSGTNFLISDAEGLISETTYLKLETNNDLKIGTNVIITSLINHDEMAVHADSTGQLVLSPPHGAIPDITPIGTGTYGEARSKINAILNVLRAKKIIDV